MKQYIVVREDLPPGAQATQSAHAMKLFTREHPEFNDVDNLALLAAPDESALFELVRRAQNRGVSVSAFVEPDFDDSLTAIAMPYEARKLVSSLPLALKHAPTGG
jgi:hypothetical protein